MNEEALFQEYSTNRALQATSPNFASYRDFVMSQMPAQANDNSGVSGVLSNVSSNMTTMKDLGKSFILNKLSRSAGLGFNPIGIGGLLLSGLGNLNEKIQSTDFARSKTLADYLDAKSYGGIDARNAASVANMAQARGIQKQMAQRPSSQVSARDAGRGGGGGGGYASNANASAPGGSNEAGSF